MSLSKELHKHKNWRGDIREFAEVAVRVLSADPEFEVDTGPSERVIRDYVQRNIISPPEREGSAAFYDYRHLVEAVAARYLIKEGWPLAKITEQFELNRSAVEAFIPGMKAVLLARSLLAESAPFEGKRRSRYATSSDIARQYSANYAAAKALLPGALNALGSRSKGAPPREILKFEITPWLSVQVDKDRFEALTSEQIRSIGDAVMASLMTSRSKGGKE